MVAALESFSNTASDLSGLLLSLIIFKNSIQSTLLSARMDGSAMTHFSDIKSSHNNKMLKHEAGIAKRIKC
jgi:hypothetical protein